MNITTVPVPGSNFTAGRQGTNVDTIVYHWIAGTQNVADIVFKDPKRQVSSHFSVEGDSVHQYVRLSDTAYHAGKWSVNLRSVGIEHSAQPGRDASDATYESSARIVAQVAKSLGKRVSDLSHIPHKAVVATACPGTIDILRIVNRAKEIESGGPAVDAVSGILASAPAHEPAPQFPRSASLAVPALRVRKQGEDSVVLGIIYHGPVTVTADLGTHWQISYAAIRGIDRAVVAKTYADGETTRETLDFTRTA